MKIDKKFWEKVDTVLDDLKNPLHKKWFTENMAKTGLMEGKSFANLLSAYLLWSEVGSEEDIERYYGYLDLGDEDD